MRAPLGIGCRQSPPSNNIKLQDIIQSFWMIVCNEHKESQLFDCLVECHQPESLNSITPGKRNINNYWCFLTFFIVREMEKEDQKDTLWSPVCLFLRFSSWRSAQKCILWTVAPGVLSFTVIYCYYNLSKMLISYKNNIISMGMQI